MKRITVLAGVTRQIYSGTVEDEQVAAIGLRFSRGQSLTLPLARPGELLMLGGEVLKRCSLTVTEVSKEIFE